MFVSLTSLPFSGMLLVGDCYVAVTGLPEPRKDHAIVMAKFARDCLKVRKRVKHVLRL
jgi:class 3 adenylate cyclase